MYQPRTNSSPVFAWLSQIGLATLVTCGTLLILSLTVLLPPWVKVKCQRQELLYFSRHVKDYERTFVGYDFLFADRKWETVGPPTAPASGQTFDVTEYRIFWPVLVGEWLVSCLAAGSLFVVLSRRLRVATEPLEADAEQVAAPKRRFS
jgi:hypothetical protein